jgi:hypothetical protein
MHPFERIRQSGAAALKSRLRWDALATGAAMIACLTVVFDATRYSRSRATERTVVAAADFVPRPRAAAPAPAAIPVELPRAPAEGKTSPPAEAPDEPIRTLMQAPALPTVVATTGFQPHPDADRADGDAARRASIVGIWAPDAGTCSARSFRDGVLPTVVNSEVAWAGETFCLFARRKESEAGWRVVAKCSTARERWTSNVRLTVADNRLTWTSERGTQVYTRCAPDLLMADAR